MKISPVILTESAVGGSIKKQKKYSKKTGVYYTGESQLMSMLQKSFYIYLIQLNK